MRLTSIFVLSFVFLVACSSTTSVVDAAPAAPSGDDGTTPPSAVGTVDATLLGAFCSNVGIEEGKVLAFPGVKDCASGTGVCVADGRRHVISGGADRIDTYCTASCESDACPPAWECADNVAAGNGAPARICVKQAAVCGDGIKQADEACEDGNVADRDGCNAKCTKVLPAGIDVRSFDAKTHYGAGLGDMDAVSKAFYITAFPRYDDGSGIIGEGSIDKVTADSFALKIAVTNENLGRGYGIEATVPRKVGKAPMTSLTGHWWRDTPKQPSTTSSFEVTKAHVDGRAYEVHIRFETTIPPPATNPEVGDAIITIDTTFIATIP